MTTQNYILTLYPEFQALVQSGDEAAVRKFLVDNFSKFPQEIQDGLTMDFFEEAITNEAIIVKAKAEFQKEGLAEMTELVKEKKHLEDESAAQKIREELQ